MSQISITVGPKSYPFVCGDGEEDHIRKLAAMIDEKYAELGNARAPQEVQNMLFAALFLADELAEARKVAKKSTENVEHEKAKSGGKKEELRAEIETLKKAEARARKEAETLKAELAEMREAARHQHDLFGDSSAEEELAETLEALAARAEEVAASLEASVTLS